MVFEESPVKDLYRVAVWWGLRHAVRVLPHGAEFQVYRGMGELAFRLPTSTRRKALQNIRRLHPDEDRARRIAREAFGTHFIEKYLNFSFPRIDAANLPRYVVVEGLQNLERATRGGRGAVLGHPHMGAAQLPHFELSARGYRMMQIGGGRAATEPSPMGRRVQAIRGRMEGLMPATVVDGRAFLRPVVKHLREGGVLLTAIDGTGGGEEMGRRAERVLATGLRLRVPMGAAFLASRAGAALLPLVTVRNGAEWGFRSIIGEEIPLPADRERAVEAGTDGLTAFLERCLLEHPGEWHFWDHFVPGELLAEEGD